MTMDQLAQVIMMATAQQAQASAQSAASVDRLAHTLAASEAQRSANQGFRALKPKREITGITATSQKQLMLEQVQFEIDLGELGISPRSEAGYRQLRSCCTGNARDIFELSIVTGNGLIGANGLENMRAQGFPQVQLNQQASLLYDYIMLALEDGLRLTPERKIALAHEIYGEAKMLNDSAQEAEVFLQRWRRGRYIMHKFQLLPDRVQFSNDLVAQGVPPHIVGQVANMMIQNDRRELNELLEHRLAPSVYAFIRGQPDEIETVDQVITLVQRWLETQRRFSTTTAQISAVHGNYGGPVYGGAPSEPDSSRAPLPSGSDGFVSSMIEEERQRIAALSGNSNAGYMASSGGARQPRNDGGKGGQPPPLCTGGPRCSDCDSHHPDCKKCPNDLAAADPAYAPGKGRCRYKVYDKYLCNSAKHFARHHKQRREEEVAAAGKGGRNIREMHAAEPEMHFGVDAWGDPCVLDDPLPGDGPTIAAATVVNDTIPQASAAHLPSPGSTAAVGPTVATASIGHAPLPGGTVNVQMTAEQARAWQWSMHGLAAGTSSDPTTSRMATDPSSQRRPGGGLRRMSALRAPNKMDFQVAPPPATLLAPPTPRMDLQVAPPPATLLAPPTPMMDFQEAPPPATLFCKLAPPTTTMDFQAAPPPVTAVTDFKLAPPTTTMDFQAAPPPTTTPPTSSSSPTVGLPLSRSAPRGGEYPPL